MEYIQRNPFTYNPGYGKPFSFNTRHRDAASIFSIKTARHYLKEHKYWINKHYIGFKFKIKNV